MNHAAVNYPADYRTQKCVVCGEPTEYFSNAEPDDDWEDKVAALLEQQAVEETEAPEIPKIEARVYVCGDHLCVNADAVYHGMSGKKDWPLKPTTLIQVGQQTFEILGFQREPRRVYFLRAFSLTLSEEDLARLSAP